jgi:uncharacterized protein YjbI with pentapeptide repeats
LIHRGFIGVGYDGGWTVKDEEKSVAAETGPPPAPDPEQKSEDRSSSVPLWLVVVAVLALGGVIEVIIYGYLERPGWIGVSGKQFWDYLDLLIVPGALAIGVYALNRAQSDREDAAENSRKASELEVEDQRARDTALQTYLDNMAATLANLRLLSHEYETAESDYESFRASAASPDTALYPKAAKEGLEKRRRTADSLYTRRGDTRTIIRAQTLTVLERVGKKRKRAIMRFLSESGLLEIGSETAISLDDADFSDANLDSMNLSGKGLRQIRLTPATLASADLSRADLSRADLSRADLSRADLSRADLGKADLSDADLNSADLRRASLRGADLRGADLRAADLRGEADLSSTALSSTDLRKASLRGANLSWAKLIGADLRGADLREADLMRVDLRGAYLKGADLRKAYLRWANLWANLREEATNLMWAKLREADLRRADLRRAYLRGAYLNSADLSGADLREANLRGADLREADLSWVIGKTNEEVKQQAISLKDATMPDGQKYEDWLKSRDRQDDG